MVSYAPELLLTLLAAKAPCGRKIRIDDIVELQLVLGTPRLASRRMSSQGSTTNSAFVCPHIP